jgi:hypothetical protein
MGEVGAVTTDTGSDPSEAWRRGAGWTSRRKLSRPANTAAAEFIAVRRTATAAASAREERRRLRRQLPSAVPRRGSGRGASHEPMQRDSRPTTAAAGARSAYALGCDVSVPCLYGPPDRGRYGLVGFEVARIRREDRLARHPAPPRHSGLRAAACKADTGHRSASAARAD